MLKNKELLSLIALVCAVLALGLSVFSMISVSGNADRVEALELENRYLQEQLNKLSAGQGQISAEAYCHLLVNSWEGSLTELSLTSGVAQVVLPKGSDLTLIQSAQLVLRQDIQEIERRAVTLVATESQSSFEAKLEGVRFDLPELAEGQQVDVWLEVVLSDGQIVLSPACGWFRSGTELLMVAG